MTTAERLAHRIAGPHATPAMIDRLTRSPELLEIAEADLELAARIATDDAHRTLAAYVEAARITNERKVA